ncbi:MAG: AI-2E family transporter [Bacteriovorax sp.]|nr:AI-2E family transporter [Bacteriovorax sp.]
MSESLSDKFIKNFFKILIALLIIFAFIYILVPFIIPVALGGILAMAFSPFISHFIKKGHSRKKSLIALTFLLFVVGIAPVTVVLIRGSKAVSTFLSEQSLIATKHNIEDRIYAVLDNFSDLNNLDPTTVREQFDSFMTTAGKYILNLFSTILSQIPNIVLLGFVTIVSFYFFLANEEHIRKIFDRYFYFTKENGDRFITLIKTCCKEVFFSNVLTGIVQASIVAGGAFFCGIGDAFIIFICTFFLSFIPLFGAGPFAFCIAILAFLEHKTGAGIAMVVVALISGIADNIVRPYLTGLGEVKVHGFITFLAIIGGVLVMGLPGLFVGPLLALLTFGALPIILDDYFPERNQE